MNRWRTFLQFVAFQVMPYGGALVCLYIVVNLTTGWGWRP